MSINDKLAMLLNEQGTEGLKGIAHTLAGYGKNVAMLPFGIGKGITIALSKTGKGIIQTLHNFDEKRFKRGMNIKELKELDTMLSELRSDSPEFKHILLQIYTKIVHDKLNKQLQYVLNEIYEKHFARLIKNKIEELKKEENPQKATGKYNELVAMLNTIWDKKSSLVNTILNAAIDHNDSREIGTTETEKAQEKTKEKPAVPDKDIQALLKLNPNKMNSEEITKVIEYYNEEVKKIQQTQAGNIATNEIAQKVLEIKRKVEGLEKAKAKK